MKLFDRLKIKRWAHILLFGSACHTSAAQDIARAEYFFDTDPGIGLASALPAPTPDDSINLSTSVNTTGLEPGYHMLYVRTATQDGLWSLQAPRRFFIKSTLTDAEYFFDNDPGTGNGTPIPVIDMLDSVSFNLSVSTVGLEPGYHMLYVRVRDQQNRWSLSPARRFIIKDMVQTAEYFFDTDPGQGNGVPITVATVSDSVNIAASVNTSGLEPGAHMLFIRTRSTTGKWSLFPGKRIHIKNEIIAAEYFFDTDPGVGNGFDYAVSAPKDSIKLSKSIKAPALAAGVHYLYFRTMDATGKWSFSGVDTITMLECATAPKKPGAITLSGGSTKICPGETRIFSIDSVLTASSFFWTVPPGATIENGQGTKSITVAFNTAFIENDTVFVIAQNSCGASPSKFKVVTRGKAPAAPSPITGEIYSVCGQSAVPYSVVEVPDLSYTWSFDNAGATISSGQGTATASADFAPSYSDGYLYVTAATGCGTSTAKKLRIRAVPAVAEGIDGPATVCTQSSHNYSVAPLSNFTSYTWTGPSGATISDGTTTSPGNTLTTASPSVTINIGSKLGTIKVKANNDCGSGGTASLKLSSGCKEVPEAMEENEQTEMILVYPNPATDRLFVEFGAEQSGAYILTVIDATGKQVILREGTAGAGTNREEINLIGLASGMYHIMIRSEDMQYQANFIVK